MFEPTQPSPQPPSPSSPPEKVGAHVACLRVAAREPQAVTADAATEPGSSLTKPSGDRAVVEVAPGVDDAQSSPPIRDVVALTAAAVPAVVAVEGLARRRHVPTGEVLERALLEPASARVHVLEPDVIRALRHDDVAREEALHADRLVNREPPDLERAVQLGLTSRARRDVEGPAQDGRAHPPWQRCSSLRSRRGCPRRRLRSPRPGGREVGAPLEAHDMDVSSKGRGEGEAHGGDEELLGLLDHGDRPARKRTGLTVMALPGADATPLHLSGQGAPLGAQRTSQELGDGPRRLEGRA